MPKNLPEQLSNDKRSQVLIAAQRLFGRFGFTKVTMDEIARDLGISKTTLYYYYPTKEQLFAAVIQHEQNRFINIMQPILDEKIPASSKLMKYTEHRLKYFRDLVTLSKLSYQSFIEMKSKFSDVLQRFAECDQKIVERIFREGVQTHEFSLNKGDKCPELFLNLLMGMRISSMRNVTVHSKPGNEINRLERDMKVFVTIFLRGISEQPATEPRKVKHK